MRTVSSKAALVLALVATLLSGLLPDGWMPNPDGARTTLFVVCTIDGMRNMAMPGMAMPGMPKQAPHHGQDHANAPCPFAAVAPLGGAQAAPALLAPQALAFAPRTERHAPIYLARLEQAHPARAPPFFA